MVYSTRINRPAVSWHPSRPSLNAYTTNGFIWPATGPSASRPGRPRGAYRMEIRAAQWGSYRPEGGSGPPRVAVAQPSGVAAAAARRRTPVMNLQSLGDGRQNAAADPARAPVALGRFPG